MEIHDLGCLHRHSIGLQLLILIILVWMTGAACLLACWQCFSVLVLVVFVLLYLFLL